MPYNTKEKKTAHNDKYYRGWYRKNGRNRSVDYQEAIKEWVQRHPKEFLAKIEVRKSIKIGKILKPENCKVCGRKTRISGHHQDYSKPLEVLWVCSSCHKKIHSGRIKGLTDLVCSRSIVE